MAMSDPSAQKRLYAGTHNCTLSNLSTAFPVSTDGILIFQITCNYFQLRGQLRNLGNKALRGMSVLTFFPDTVGYFKKAPSPL
jgi:hypothetical protein